MLVHHHAYYITRLLLINNLYSMNILLTFFFKTNLIKSLPGVFHPGRLSNSGLTITIFDL